MVYLYQLLKNETTAQDIMQETYITAFLKIQSLEKSSQIRSWLNRIAVNKCKNYLKGKGEIQLDDEIFENQAIVDERISIPEEYISDKAKREIILSIMQEVLSDVQYQTVIMHYFNEMTVDEIAEVFECSRGTVLSRLNYSRAKMKTAIEDYENKSGDRLHGVVVVPFFTTIFREQAKSLAVPNITIKLPNGQTLATSATKGFATGAKSTVSSIVKATATATVKTDDGKTVTVKVDDVKTTVSNNNNSNKGNTEKKENTSSKKDNTSKTNTSDNDKKPAKPSTSSSTVTTTEKPKQKVWVVDYKTVHHDGYWEVVGTKEEPVYGWVGYNVCNDCGMKMTDDNQEEHLTWEADNGGKGSYHYEEEYVQTGTKTVEDKKWVEPHDEKVVSGGHYEYR